MLLITDRRESQGGAVRRDDTTIVHLGEHVVRSAAFTTILCDVALGDMKSVHALREALAWYRSSAAVPVHFVLRDRRIASRAIANALGATSISIEEDAAVFRAVPRFDEVPAGEAIAPTSEPSVEEDIAAVATCLSQIFGAATTRAPVDRHDLEQGAIALLRSTKEAGIGRWVDIVRRYDDATYQHCLLVAGLTAAFATHLGFSLAKQRTLVQAALLHDIGKARVPTAILNKAGPLNAAELMLIRKHPTDGYYMLVKQPNLDSAVLDVVLHHHEMLDGSGYPQGLRHEQIPELTRIVTICDIQAALIERRSYRSPMKVEEAYRTLVAMGKKLDTTLLMAFESVVEAMRGAGESVDFRASA